MSPVGNRESSQEVTRVPTLIATATIPATTQAHKPPPSTPVTLTGQNELLLGQVGPCGWQEVELQQNQLKRRAGEGKKEDGTLGMSYLLLSRPSFSHLENGTSHHP